MRLLLVSLLVACALTIASAANLVIPSEVYTINEDQFAFYRFVIDKYDQIAGKVDKVEFGGKQVKILAHKPSLVVEFDPKTITVPAGETAELKAVVYDDQSKVLVAIEKAVSVISHAARLPVTPDVYTTAVFFTPGKKPEAYLSFVTNGAHISTVTSDVGACTITSSSMFNEFLSVTITVDYVPTAADDGKVVTFTATAGTTSFKFLVQLATRPTFVSVSPSVFKFSDAKSKTKCIPYTAKLESLSAVVPVELGVTNSVSVLRGGARPGREANTIEGCFLCDGCYENRFCKLGIYPAFQRYSNGFVETSTSVSFTQASGGGLPTAAYIGIAVGIVAVAAIVALVIYCRKKRSQEGGFGQDYGSNYSAV